jgi:aminopeptidase N
MKKLLLIIGIFHFSCFLHAQTHVSGGVLKPEQALMDIRHYSIKLDVDPDKGYYEGYTEITLDLAGSSSVLLLDLDSLFTVSGIWVNGLPHSFQHASGMIRINGKNVFEPGRYVVKVAYGGKPHVAVNPPWDGGIQWSRDSLGRHWVAMSCQEDGADIFFPCKDHPSDEPNEGVDMMITVPKGMVVAGPGLLQRQQTRGNKSTWHWKTNYTINNYCVVFNAGYYKVERRTFQTVAGRNVPMEYYVLDYNQHRAAKHLDLLERSTRLLEKYFGEFPFAKEKIGIVETPHLGMEHQTMNAYGNKYRYTKIGDTDFDWLMHHEFGHEWWANKVSNKDWGHMWIQEGICSFGDVLFYNDYGGKQGYLKRMKEIALQAKHQLPIVQGDVVDSRQAYHPDIYGKGAFFMHTLRFVMGDEVFFPALKAFAMDPAFTYDQTVVTADVLKHFSKYARKDLTPLFKLYLYSTDKLSVRVRQTAPNVYQLSLENVGMELPVEVETSEGRKRLMLSGKATRITSATMPLMDPDGYYLKKVTYE